MNAEEHPDFLAEKERLDETVQYIREVLAAAKDDHQAFQGNIKQALIDLDHLDSSNSYTNILANANRLGATERDIEHLEVIQNRPYFARIDFSPEGTERVDPLYIGKTSLLKKDSHEPVIVDWRSPIANMYYEGQLGAASYEAHGRTFTGELKLKRQYSVKNADLDEIRDIDLTARDQMLQESLSTNADSRLKDIVSTIQAEQNQIIRADMTKPLIVQGVAGSGKTTIALHRMAYFIYTCAEDFDPEQMLILAPNRLFLDYISDVLPELGVGRVTQTTMTDYVQGALGTKLDFISKDEKLVSIIDGAPEAKTAEWAASVKSSQEYFRALQDYANDLASSWVPEEDLMLERYTIFSAERMNELFYEEYTYLPPYKRLLKLKEIVKTHVKQRSAEIIQKVENLYEEKIEKTRHGVRDEETRREKVVKLMDKKETHLETLKAEAKKIVPSFTKQLPKKTVFQYYEAFLTKENIQETYLSSLLSKEERLDLQKQSKAVRKMKRYDLEDAAPLLYLQVRLFGIDSDWTFQNVFIDEAQDYSPLEMQVLKEASGTSQFTILGDLSQGIHAYRGIKGWSEITEDVFPDATYLTLRQSYRSTVEIMNAANEVIRQQPYEDMILAEPVVRHDEEPTSIRVDGYEEAAKKIAAKVKMMQDDGYQSFAVIGKTSEECAGLNTALSNTAPELTSAVLDEDEEHGSRDIAIVPSYLSKGLEFDAVFISVLTETYKKTTLETKLLYVAMTRALHRLYYLEPSE
ncbi:RNA polymerase recycling motor HelD [Salisediminibacterium halotolerans]|uniref:DNA helicase-2 / ATP-dependent DNA helicase PcrA n=1 Tax=Salisediminibacterium halotolerans TaxID=517425 RepID=A0A1H9WD70_9BACI|nr:RNA polymerase recycling motor HelD [Salisediminibacterium haloalkalitolerans]SES31868.1 DNA helicase-2 / ATP-dependent DNA helicase PcrA [Salisediminibacterium haloalkalitolerans]